MDTPNCLQTEPHRSRVHTELHTHGDFPLGLESSQTKELGDLHTHGNGGHPRVCSCKAHGARVRRPPSRWREVPLISPTAYPLGRRLEKGGRKAESVAGERPDHC